MKRKELIMKFHELSYADESLGEIIKKEFPEAVFTDASDFIHNDRFEVDIDSEDNDIEKKFYMYAIKNGFSEVCFQFRLMVYDKKYTQEIMGWVNELKEGNNGGVDSGVVNLS